VLLKGELAAAELDLAGLDELIRVEEPLEYDLEAQLLDGSVLAQGSLALDLQCELRTVPEAVHPPAGIDGLGVPFAPGRGGKRRWWRMIAWT